MLHKQKKYFEIYLKCTEDTLIDYFNIQLTNTNIEFVNIKKKQENLLESIEDLYKESREHDHDERYDTKDNTDFIYDIANNMAKHLDIIKIKVEDLELFQGGVYTATKRTKYIKVEDNIEIEVEID
jgi:Na+/phosphate symporter